VQRLVLQHSTCYDDHNDDDDDDEFDHESMIWLNGSSLEISFVKGQGHPGQERHFSALSVAFVRCMFGKTSLASSFI